MVKNIYPLYNNAMWFLAFDSEIIHISTRPHNRIRNIPFLG